MLYFVGLSLFALFLIIMINKYNTDQFKPPYNFENIHPASV